MLLHCSYFVHWTRVSVWASGCSLLPPAIFLVLVGYLMRVPKNLLGGQRINTGKSFRNIFGDEEVTRMGKMFLRLVESFNIFLEEELYHLGRNPQYLSN